MVNSAQCSFHSWGGRYNGASIQSGVHSFRTVSFRLGIKNHKAMSRTKQDSPRRHQVFPGLLLSFVVIIGVQAEGTAGKELSALCRVILD